MNTRTDTELKPFVISDGEEITPEEKTFLETGKVPDGFRPPDGIEPQSDAEPAKTSTDTSTGTDTTTKVDPKTPASDEDGEEVVIVGKDGKPRAQNGRFVPHQALHAEREEHKKTRAELQTFREKFTAGDARLRTLFELAGVDPETGKAAAKSPANPLQEETIEFKDNPIEAWNQQQRRVNYLAEQLTDRDKKIDGVNQRFEDQNTNSATKTWLETDIRTFVAKEPAFGMAWAHVVEGLKKELEIAGIPENEIEGELNARQGAFIKDARAKGKSAAQLIWNLAEVRGFKKPEVELGADGKPVMKQKGPAPGTQQAAQQLQQIKKGQEASASLSSAGGSSDESLTLSKLTDMSEEEYASLRKKLGKGGLKQYLGA